MSQVKQCQPRSMWPSRSSHSWSLFSVATSWLSLLGLLVDAAVQTASPCEVSQNSSTQTSDQSGSSLSLDVAAQTTSCSASSSFLDAAVQTPLYSPLSQDVSTQSGSRTASSFSVDAALQTSTHSAVLIDAATQLNLTEFLIGWIYSDRPLDRRHPFCQSPPSIMGAHCGTFTAARTRTTSPSSCDCDSAAVAYQCQQFLLSYSAADCKYHQCGNTPSSPCWCQA